MITSNRKAQKGNLVAAAVIIIVGLATFGLSVVRTISSTSASSDLALQGYQSRYLAESGLEYGSFQVKNNIDINNPATYCDGVWKTTQNFSDGQFRFKCTYYIPNIVTTTVISDISSIIPISSTMNVAPIGRVQIGSEQVDYSDVSTDTTICGSAPCLVVKARGVNNTIATAHSAGTSIVEAQLVIEAEGAVPTLASPSAKKILQKAIAITALPYTNAWAVGRDGAVYRRMNNLWSRATTSPSTLYDFNSVTCPSATDCWTVGNGEKIYRWNGTDWLEYTGANFTGSSVSLKAITCVSGTDCWILTGNQDVYHWDGANWILNTHLSESLNGISCANANFCIIAANNGAVFKWDGFSWISMSSGTSKNLLSVSCPTSALCFAVGQDGKIIRMSGTTWNTESSPIAHDLITISCSDSNNCWAFGTNRDRNAHYYYGAWNTEIVSILNKHINSVYCTAHNNCFLAVNRFDANDALIGIWNGLSWGNDFVQTGAAEDLLSVTTDHTESTTLEFENIGWREVIS